MTRLPVRTGGVGHVLFLWPLGRGGKSGRGADAPFFFWSAATLCLILLVVLSRFFKHSRSERRRDH